jgi:hypothetical protein
MRERSMEVSFNMNRINPNQTQVSFTDGRFETMTNEELEDFLSQRGMAANTDMGFEQEVTE